MAVIADVLRHLVTHAPALSDTNRAEFQAAVDDEYGPDPVAVAAAQAEAAAKAAEDVKDAKIAQLEAELAAAKAVG